MTRRPARTRRGFLLAAIAAVHLLLAWALRNAGVWADRSPAVAAPAPLVVTLLAPPRAATNEPAPADRAPVAARRPSPRVPPPAPALQWVAPAPAAETAPVLDTPPPPAAPTPRATPAPLVLDLPRSASMPARSPALDDPRANARTRTLESRLADTMGGDDRLIVEPLADGRLRYRKGADCIVVAPNRDGQLDPFNQSVQARLKAAGPC